MNSYTASRNRFFVLRLVLFSVCLLLFSPMRTTLAQSATATLSGTVQDEQRGIIAGADVSVVDVGKGIKRQTLTNDEGYFTVPLLPPSTYTVRVEMPGFGTMEIKNVVLNVGDQRSIRIQLRVAEIADTINVVSETVPMLNTSDPSQGQVIDNRKIVDLPLNGRDYIQLARISMGASEPTRGAKFDGFSASGQRVSQNNYLLDGVDNNNVQNAAQAERAEAVKPSIDAIQEFKVLTNSFSAEYGRAGGGIVNAVLKSGSNELHGTLFAFMRNELLDAKNFFDDPKADKPPFKRSQFGFSSGGPVVRDRTFFFLDYEGTRIRETRTVVNTVPTQAMRSGDFSQTGVVIYDPLTFDRTTRRREPFPGNRIPDSRIDPVARKAAAWYPTPQNDRLIQNFLSNPPDNGNVDKFDIRVDHAFRPQDSIYYRFSFQRDFHPGSPPLPPPAFGGSLLAADTENNGRNMALVWNHNFSSALIASTRVAWNRILTELGVPLRRNLSVDLGLAGVERDEPGGPQFVMAGLPSLGVGGFLPLIADSQARQLVHDMTWSRGRHGLKFGLNFTWLQQHTRNPRLAPGIFTFTGNFTRDLPSFRGGHPFADFLLGIPSSTQVSTWFFYQGRMPLYHFYIQDEYRVTSRLTLNLGLRYEPNLPWVEKNNRISILDIDTDPQNPQIVLARDGSRLDRSLATTDKNNLAPRLGFAYEIRTGTVFRGGYGIYYGAYEGGGLATNPPFLVVATLTTDNITPAFLLRDGVPKGIITPANARGLSLNAEPRHPPTAYTQQWTLNLQQRLATDWLLEIGYSGSQAHKLQNLWNANYALPGPGNLNSRRRWRTVVWPGTNLTVGPLGPVQLRSFDGDSNYHALLTKIEKRFSRGFTLLGSYVWSKTIGDSCGTGNASRDPTLGCEPQDPRNRRLERSLENQHLGHRFVGSYILELPFGQGKRWGAAWSAAASGILGGWSVAAIVNLSTGLPLTPGVIGDPANTGTPNRPNLVANPHLGRGTRNIDEWFNTDAFSRNAPFTFGNAGRNILIAPGVGNVDFAAYKQFHIREQVALQFRFEAFNFFNSPYFGPPNAQLGNPNFGRITLAGRPRNLQFGLKLIY